jgi:ankyrin repeat protein
MSSKYKLNDLLKATESGNEQLVQAIVADNPTLVNRRGTKKDGRYRGMTSLLLSLVYKHSGITRILLNNGADPNVQSTEANKFLCLLFVIGMKRDLPMLELLLKKGANPNLCNSSGDYPLIRSLIWYMSHDTDEEARRELLILLKHGADIDYKPPRFMVSVREYLENLGDVPKKVLKILGI